MLHHMDDLIDHDNDNNDDDTFTFLLVISTIEKQSNANGLFLVQVAIQGWEQV